ncbi:MAG: glycosyltransferase [Clostridium sp.]|nr:glycosyltransferase [Clostridium sp.]MCM1172359.1 glycosyltransferase [Clostridium sp.]MCM1209891.1 glycosyltransferase [Ruminococcus sp.]
MDISANLQTNVNKILEHKDNSPYLCVIMPAYNEGQKIYDNLITTSDILNGFVKNYFIIAVNDGSTDNTGAEIMRASSDNSNIAYVSYEENHGKGFAIATGVKYAAGSYIAFLDSDLELNPKMLKYFLSTLRQSDADIAIGSKMHKSSRLHYPLIRRILSVGYYLFLKLLFKLNLKDTQTGIKLFKVEVVKPICESLTTFGYAFDIELLVRAKNAGCKIIELPVELNYSRSKRDKMRFSPAQIYRMFKDTLKIRRELKS